MPGQASQPAVVATRIMGLIKALGAREGGAEALLALGLSFDPHTGQSDNEDDDAQSSQASKSGENDMANDT